MASITIRNLDEAAKQALRERAARNGRSMEEEARILLGVMTGRDGEGPGAGQLQSGSGSGAVIPAGHVSTNGAISWRHGALAGKTILLVITGGIASYKALDLIRRPWLRPRRTGQLWDALLCAITAQLIESGEAVRIQRRIVGRWGTSVRVPGFRRTI